MDKKRQVSCLIASPRETEQKALYQYLTEQDFFVVISSSLEDCLEKLRSNRYEYCFINNQILGSHSKSKQLKDFKQSLAPFYDLYPTLPIFVLGKAEETRNCVRYVQAGAQDYLIEPIDPLEIKLIIDNQEGLKQQESELSYLRDVFWKNDVVNLIKTQHPNMESIFQKIKAAAPTVASILLLGESGTGKGFLARLIHEHSLRFESPFISVHCGAIPENLVESELFGHEKGAFTGADSRKLGKFEIAHGGTLFLDEIGTMPLSAQIKLLQVLQDKFFQRVGGNQNIPCDVRIIAASNANLKELSEKGEFRADLFFRLNVFPIDVPPLRERTKDIEGLARHFLKTLNQRYLKNILDIDQEVLKALENYTWPGNIRELENLIERAYILEMTQILSPESFPSDIFSFEASSSKKEEALLSLAETRRIEVEKVESRYLKQLLASQKGKISKSAEVAGITTRQLHKLLSKYGIRKEEFKYLPPNLAD